LLLVREDSVDMFIELAIADEMQRPWLSILDYAKQCNHFLYRTNSIRVILHEVESLGSPGELAGTYSTTSPKVKYASG